MAPLTRCRATPGTDPNALIAEYYAQRASAGLIVTEGTQVLPSGKGYMGTRAFAAPSRIAGWRLATDAVHAKRGKIVAQLWHRRCHRIPTCSPAARCQSQRAMWL